MAARFDLPIRTLTEAFAEELPWIEVLIRRESAGFMLRHEADRAVAAGHLRPVSLPELRELAQFTATGAFRPNKAAPSLRRGWRTQAATPAELETALGHLYPGSLADWFEGRKEQPGLIPFRAFTGRQSGVYQITQTLTDTRATAVVRAGCAAEFCRRQRRWSVADLAPDPVAGKSVVPCLEPCALLLELARRDAEAQAAAQVTITLSAGERATLLHALDRALVQPAAELREGELGRPENPRRLALLRERLADAP